MTSFVSKLQLLIIMQVYHLMASNCYMSEGPNLVHVVFKFRGNLLKPCRVISGYSFIQNGGRSCSVPCPRGILTLQSGGTLSACNFSRILCQCLKFTGIIEWTKGFLSMVFVSLPTWIPVSTACLKRGGKSVNNCAHRLWMGFQLARIVKAGVGPLL